MPTAVDCSVHQGRFLAAFAACCSFTQAARWAKISRQAHYNWLREDPTYRERFELARVKAVQSLEDEAIRRGREGVRKAVRYKGKVVGYETEYSDTCLLATLKANAPEKYRERTDTTVSAPGGGPVEQRIIVEYVDSPAKAPATPSAPGGDPPATETV